MFSLCDGATTRFVGTVEERTRRFRLGRLPACAGRLRLGAQAISLADPTDRVETALEVDATPPPLSVSVVAVPGALEVRVRDWAGRPVDDAEVVVRLEDRARVEAGEVRSLGLRLPDWQDTLRTSTERSHQNFRPEVETDFAEGVPPDPQGPFDMGVSGGTGCCAYLPPPPQVVPRGPSVWIPDARTDAAGRVRVPLSLPDPGIDWHLLVVAVHGVAQVGLAEMPLAEVPPAPAP